MLRERRLEKKISETRSIVTVTFHMTDKLKPLVCGAERMQLLTKQPTAQLSHQVEFCSTDQIIPIFIGIWAIAYTQLEGETLQNVFIFLGTQSGFRSSFFCVSVFNLACEQNSSKHWYEFSWHTKNVQSKYQMQAEVNRRWRFSQ